VALHKRSEVITRIDFYPEKLSKGEVVAHFGPVRQGWCDKFGRHLSRVTPCSYRNPLGMREAQLLPRLRSREQGSLRDERFALANWFAL